MSKLVNIEAEQSVLGALLNDAESFDRVGSLKSTDFSASHHSIIFKAIESLVVANKPADTISVYECVKRDGIEIDYLNKLSVSSASSARIKDHSKILRDVALRRKVADVGQKFEMLAESSLSFEDCLEKASSEFEKITNQELHSDPVSAEALMGGIYDVMHQRLEGKVKRIPTGFIDLDKKLGGGLDRGDLVIIAGRPAMGKTAMALSVSENIATDYSVLVFSMEMSKEQLRDRFIAQIGRVPLSFVIQPVEDSTHTNSSDWQKVVNAQQQASKLNLHIYDRSALTLTDIRIKARNIKRKHGLDVIVLDYLQLMASSEKQENRTQEVSTFSRGLKSIAKDLGVAFIVLSQLNRSLEQRPNKRPMMSDLRESGAIEQDADIIMFVYRDEVYDQNSTQKGVAEIIIGKQRQGSIGTVPLSFIADQVRFDNLAYQWTPPESMKKAAEYRSKRGFD